MRILLCTPKISPYSHLYYENLKIIISSSPPQKKKQKNTNNNQQHNHLQTLSTTNLTTPRPMAKQSLVILAVLALLVCCATWASAQVIKTDRPIIGIITHPETEASSAYPHRQYIAASYVKWIESSGGRVVPIPHNIDLAEGKKLLRQLNGLMLVGGAFIYNDHVGALIDEAVQMNREGIYFPIHGTCLGFEYVFFLTPSPKLYLMKLIMRMGILPATITITGHTNTII